MKTPNGTPAAMVHNVISSCFRQLRMPYSLSSVRLFSPAAIFAMLLGVTSVVQPAPAHAQALEGGARSAALGGASTALRGARWLDANAAVGATRESRAVSFFASESYGLSELRLAQFQYTEPLPFASVSLGASSFGFEDYRLTSVTLAAARTFSLGSTREAAFGSAIRYSQVSITGYGSASAVGLTLAGLVAVSPTLDLGFQATNLNAPSLGDEDELPRILSAGLFYRPDDRVGILLDVVKDVRFDPSIRGGLELQIADPLVLRTGFGTSPSRFSLGTGVAVRFVSVDLAVERHRLLGWTPAASLNLDW